MIQENRPLTKLLMIWRTAAIRICAPEQGPSESPCGTAFYMMHCMSQTCGASSTRWVHTSHQGSQCRCMAICFTFALQMCGWMSCSPICENLLNAWQLAWCCQLVIELQHGLPYHSGCSRMPSSGQAGRCMRRRCPLHLTGTTMHSVHHCYYLPFWPKSYSMKKLHVCQACAHNASDRHYYAHCISLFLPALLAQILSNEAGVQGLCACSSVITYDLPCRTAAPFIGTCVTGILHNSS
jgi:hypothetical protein